MRSNKKYHYTYLLIIEKEKDLYNYYIGCRSCDTHPNEDVDYNSSSKHVKAMTYVSIDKIVLDIFDTRESALKEEIRLHYLHDVGVNPLYVNKAKQTSTKFDTTGISFPKSREAIAKIVEFHKGRKRSPETCKKIGDSLRGRSNANKGKKRSIEHCVKMSRLLKGRPGNKDFRHTEESKKKMSESSKGKLHTEETKRKISNILKNTKLGHENPAARAVRCAELDKKFNTVTDATKFINAKSKSSICNALAGRAKTAGGYTWEYVEMEFDKSLKVKNEN